MLSLSEFYSEMREKIKEEFNEYLSEHSLDGLKEITEEYNFVDCENLTMAVFPSVASGETVSRTEGGLSVATTIMLYVDDTYSKENNTLTLFYFDAFLDWIIGNNPLFSQHDTIDNATLLRMNENCDFNGFVVELKSRIYTDMDYS